MWWTEFNRRVAAALLIISCSLLAVSQALATEPSVRSQATETLDIQAAKEQLGATFKNFQFDKIEPSQIPGIVEIYTSGKIIYYAPAQKILFMGEMYSSNGISLTEQRINTFASEKVSDIDRSVALVIGTGTKEVIEFVDPDCGHCRAAHRWFTTESRSDIRHLIYFMPLKGRAQAEGRVLELLCSKPEDQKAALSSVFNPSGPVDLQQAVRCKKGVEQLAAQGRVAQQIGVYATPFYVINGKVTAGFNAETIAAQLADTPATVSKVDR